MSTLRITAAAILGATLSAGSALAYDRHFDFGQVWGDAQGEHRRDDSLSATPRDVMRQRPRHVFDSSTRPHDPTGAIVLEGAK